MKKENHISYTRRFGVIMAAIIVICMVYIGVLGKMELVDGETYQTKAMQYTANSVTITAARGEIVDRYGRAIAQNRMGYTVYFSRAEMPKGSENEVIWQLCRILKEADEEWIDNCPIVISPSGYASYTEESDKLINKMKSTLTLQTYATAQNCLDTMNEKFEVGNLPTDTAREIMGVRLNMLQMEFSSANPYIFAEDVSLATAQKIMENSALLPGVYVEVMPIREYVDGSVAPHLIGITGSIYAEEYEELKKQGYSINAEIGKFGVEKEYEKYLKGTNGQRKIQRDSDGKIVYEYISRDAVPGNTVVLTIDSELQKVAQNSMATTIQSIAARGRQTESLDGEDADAGALIVMNCRTFEVLAAVTYPSYDLNDYNTKYSEMVADKAAPLYNRALNGTYAPGSTFKPAVALAGLQTGVIDKNTKIECTGRYYLEEYDNFYLNCLHVHGTLGVTDAIGESCNVFFYHTGYQLGITRLNDYCKQLGFGVATGIGMGESKGILAGREEREAKEENWYAADTLTASIGQNDNKFTPLQLCAYVSTIANGGTRYQARLVKTIKSYDMVETVVEDTSENPVVYNALNVDKTFINLVKRGMLAVTQDEGGTASDTFDNYPIQVGGKTGTADTVKNKYSANALFICFAPFEEPEIAIAIVGERCAFGSYMAIIARDIMDEYFFSEKTTGYNVQTEGTVVA